MATVMKWNDDLRVLLALRYFLAHLLQKASSSKKGSKLLDKGALVKLWNGYADTPFNAEQKKDVSLKLKTQEDAREVAPFFRLLDSSRMKAVKVKAADFDATLDSAMKFGHMLQRDISEPDLLLSCGQQNWGRSVMMVTLLQLTYTINIL